MPTYNTWNSSFLKIMDLKVSYFRAHVPGSPCLPNRHTHYKRHSPIFVGQHYIMLKKAPKNTPKNTPKLTKGKLFTSPFHIPFLVEMEG